MSHQPIQNFVALFWGVIGKTPGLISRNNFVKKIFVCIGHRDNVLARCDSIFPLLRCQGVWNKTRTQLSLPKSPLRIRRITVLGMLKDSGIILDAIRRSFFLPNQQQQKLLPQFESILDGHLSRHLLPAPFRPEIENTP